ncbi:Putative transposase [Nitrosotalea sinensis]|uniref:Transposase n=1 Tax=Nitrosotalea sinensis TaxID=1499975 RepID=A0A2H1EFW1_9ARCH|nr:hypothetical protein [Candidatus Nitrosotalea sinensis]SHO44260.1 Putative transposase [Candidatus Nitrosotalea sinensis]
MEKLNSKYKEKVTMLLFNNLNFHIEQPQNEWHFIGYTTKSTDGRIINIKPVNKRQFRESGVTVLMHAIIKLTSLPTLLEDKSIEIPQNELSELGKTLRYFSQLISISDMSKVSISSPHPSQGFIPENESESRYLTQSKGFELKLISRMVFHNNFFREIYENQLLDRTEGVKIMANANGQTDNLSKFKELVRLFENAFGNDGSRLAESLYAFLKSSEFDYSKDEIADWMVTKRDGATHADRRITQTLVHSEDMNQHIDRIHQAAYDVLFNKKSWGNQTINRQTTFEPAQKLEKNHLVFIKSRIENDRRVGLTQNDEPFYYTGSDEANISIDKFVAPKEWWTKYFQKDPFEVQV